jgi:hypothetical protein
MGDQHGQQWLAQRFELAPQRATLALGQSGIDGDDAAFALDQKRVRVDTTLSRRVTVDGERRC